jgi:tripartite-type tricarboxylate transporter receptor subunit TctC
MKHGRSKLASVVAFALGITAMASAAPSYAQEFPTKPITVIIPFGPGGTTDVMMRLMQKSLSDALGVPIVVENRAGASGAIGMGAVARANPDGYTLGMTAVGQIATIPAIRKTPYTPDSFDHICSTYDVPLMMQVPKDSQFKTFGDIIKFAKDNPGSLTYGSSGAGTVLHLSMLMLADQAKLDMLHVPYKSSGDMVAGLMGKQIMAFTETPTMSAKYGLRGLALFSEKRLKEYPDVPTTAELGYPTRVSVWGGLVAPRGLPEAVRKKLEAACFKAVNNDEYRSRAETYDTPLVYKDAATFKSFAKAEFERYSEIVKKNNLKID